MTIADVLVDAFGRIRDAVHRTLDGLGDEELTARLDAEANTICWLVWHLTRVQDDHVAAVAGADQVWTAGGFAERFGLPLDLPDIGYGHRPDQMTAVQADADLLVEYHDAVHAATVDFVRRLTDADLDRVVDTRWDPPVTLGVRLVSVIDDDLEHAGQAAYVRGVLERERPRAHRP
ncbi:MAG TPA: DUF664 domain-containing protein [Acidimicrobiales bacterium]|nr:DUF664 domain-containing protein [Acidimicrobiales bacterium]